MGVRFLHTADWQLGKAFQNLGAEAGTLLRDARRAAVRKIAELAAERRVDAVLVAGDIFDHADVSTQTITGCLGAMAPFSGDWILLPGNHDAAVPGSVWERVRLRIPSGTRIHLATSTEPLLLAEGRLAVLPAPLRRRHEALDQTAVWDDLVTPSGACRVGLAHGSVQGILPEAAESTNPVSPERVKSARLNYLALGDWHGSLQIDERIWYAGTPERDRFTGNDAGNVLLVEIDTPDGGPRVEKLSIGMYSWHLVKVELHDRTDVERFDRELAAMIPSRQNIVRLVLRGALRLPDHEYLQQRLEWWRGQVVAFQVEEEDLDLALNEQDFAALQPPGFVAQAAAALQNRASAGDGAAGRALALLYEFCRQAGVGG